MPDKQQRKPSHSSVLGADTWKQGMKLGFWVVGAFLLGVVIIFLLGTLVGLSLGMRILVALLAGPVIGTIGFLWGWRFRAEERDDKAE